MRSTDSATLKSPGQPEMVLAKIERCLHGATNYWQLHSTQAFLSLYYRQYGNPLPEREQILHNQLFARQQCLQDV